MRITNRVVAAIVSLALLAAGLLIAIEILLGALGVGPWILPWDDWYRNATRNEWSIVPHRWLFIGLILAGLALLVLQFIRRRAVSLPLRTTHEGVDADLSRTALEKSLGRAAEQVDGISGAKVRVSPTRARVMARTNRRIPGDLERRVSEAVRERLGQLDLARVLPVSVSVRHREER